MMGTGEPKPSVVNAKQHGPVPPTRAGNGDNAAGKGRHVDERVLLPFHQRCAGGPKQSYGESVQMPFGHRAPCTYYASTFCYPPRPPRFHKRGVTTKMAHLSVTTEGGPNPHISNATQHDITRLLDDEYVASCCTSLIVFCLFLLLFYRALCLAVRAALGGATKRRMYTESSRAATLYDRRVYRGFK